MKTRSILIPVVLLSALAFVFTSCKELAHKVAMIAVEKSEVFEYDDTVKWGSVVEQDIDLPPFTAIDAKGLVHIVFKQDSVCSVRVRANKKCLEKYKFSVRKDELNVESSDFDGSVNGHSPAVTLYIAAPNLSSVEFAGAGKLELPGVVELSGPLEVELEGAGEICIDSLTVQSLNVEISGAAKCTLAKVVAADDIEIEVNGASDINANVFCRDLKVEFNGAGNGVLSGECKSFICDENGASKVNFSNLKR